MISGWWRNTAKRTKKRKAATKKYQETDKKGRKIDSYTG